jgi:LPXTG-motif cell wall-anchored protein
MSEIGKLLGAATGPGLGAVVLPNTGENHVLFFVALISIVIGSAIILSTVARIAAKKFYRE